MLYSKTSVINNTNLRRFVEVLQELELKDAGKQNAMDLKMNAEGSELFADDSGNILDEFLTEIENLIECKVFFFKPKPNYATKKTYWRILDFRKKGDGLPCKKIYRWTLLYANYVKSRTPIE